ncbi:hypothetical protein jhhlp_004073, partial [Lomentospora prolificans]
GNMGTLAYPSQPLVPTESPCPTLLNTDDADYLVDVLCAENSKTETELDEQLISEAAALGIDTTLPAINIEKRIGSSLDSLINSFSTDSQTRPTSRSTSTSQCPSSTPNSPSVAEIAIPANPRCWSESLGFEIYDKYLSYLGPNITQPKYVRTQVPEHTDASRPRRAPFPRGTSIANLRIGLRARISWKKQRPNPSRKTTSCVCCRDDFAQSCALRDLPCGHTYCGECLKIMIDQAAVDESKMPPRCCTLPIPSSVLAELLDREAQVLFLKAVVQFSTPWESRVFCPNTTCGEFIPPRNKVDPKHPFVVVCPKCSTKACSMCKREAHQRGQDCPDDWDLDAVLKIGEKSGWRRCYRCRTLVELAQGCTHMTCRCKAQFCYICGAVWDPTVGCPNFCNGEEELERRQAEEAARVAEREAEKEAREAAAAAEAIEQQDARERTANSSEFLQLVDEQASEFERFQAFIRKRRDVMWARQLQKKLALSDKFSDQMEKMKDRHAKTVTHLEDRQLAAEMDLRETLEQSERSIRIRLKYMEAYCDKLGQSTDSDMPPRVVTERDLRELGKQYNLRDGMERLHTAKINVLRDRQLKAMEELVERQEEEWQKLLSKRDEEIENLAAEFALEEDMLAREFGLRQTKLQWRWNLQVEILRRKLEEEHKVKYASIPIPRWPPECSVSEDLD